MCRASAALHLQLLLFLVGIARQQGCKPPLTAGAAVAYSVARERGAVRQASYRQLFRKPDGLTERVSVLRQRSVISPIRELRN